MIFFPLNTHHLVITSNLITATDVKNPLPTHILHTETHPYKLSFHLNALLLMYIRVATKDMIHTAMIYADIQVKPDFSLLKMFRRIEVRSISRFRNVCDSYIAHLAPVFFLAVSSCPFVPHPHKLKCRFAHVLLQCLL